METVAHLMTLTVHLRVPLGQTTYRRNYHPNIYVRHIPNNVAVLTLNPWQLSHLWVVLRSWSNFIWVGSGFEGVKMIHIDMDLFALRTGYLYLVVLWSNICFGRSYKRNGSEFRGHRYAQRSYTKTLSRLYWVDQAQTLRRWRVFWSSLPWIENPRTITRRDAV